MVMGRDSLSEGRGFESWHRILDGHFHIDLLLKLYCLFEKTENKQKRGRGWPTFLKKYKDKEHRSERANISQN